MSWLRTLMHQEVIDAANFLQSMPLSAVHSAWGSAQRQGGSAAGCCSWADKCAAAPLLTPACVSVFLFNCAQPIIVWSCIIGGVGLAMPLVVPPIREAMGYGVPTPKVPPPVRTVSWGGDVGALRCAVLCWSLLGGALPDQRLYCYALNRTRQWLTHHTHPRPLLHCR